jgi:hypothetical protein
MKSGHPIWGTHKKMTGSAEQELREFMRLKHHSHELKNQQLGKFSLFRDPGGRRFKSSLPDESSSESNICRSTKCSVNPWEVTRCSDSGPRPPQI